MEDIPDDWKDQLRDLCLPPGKFDPAGGTMYRWTFHDGSTWAFIAFSEPELDSHKIVGWAALTQQEEPHNVIGVYVGSEHRGKGLAKQLISGLLLACEKVATDYSNVVIAVSERYSKYASIISAHGFTHKDWD
jgi:GNAT superfamily N-acetyltransferase